MKGLLWKQELLVGELDDGDLADDHDGLVHTEMVPLDGEQGPAGFVAGELDGDTEEEDSLGAEVWSVGHCAARRWGGQVLCRVRS